MLSVMVLSPKQSGNDEKKEKETVGVMDNLGLSGSNAKLY